MEKIKLAEQVLRNSQDYRLGFISYSYSEEGIVVVPTNQDYFSDFTIISVMKYIGLNTYMGNNKQILIYAN